MMLTSVANIKWNVFKIISSQNYRIWLGLINYLVYLHLSIRLYSNIIVCKNIVANISIYKKTKKKRDKKRRLTGIG